MIPTHIYNIFNVRRERFRPGWLMQRDRILWTVRTAGGILVTSGLSSAVVQASVRKDWPKAQFRLVGDALNLYSTERNPAPSDSVTLKVPTGMRTDPSDPWRGAR